MLEVRHLTKRYQSIAAVDDVSFTIRPGQILGYLGPNGSGKSTTVKALTGLVEPTSGEILFNGVDVRKDMVAFKHALGYVPEEAHLYPHLTGREYLQLTGRLRGMPAGLLEEKADGFLRLFGLQEARYSLIGSYSKGMRQKVLISAALLHNPDVLIFDEPFSGLDVTAAEVFKLVLRSLASEGKLILYSSHVLEVVEKVCSEVVILRKGKVVAQDTITKLRDLLTLPSLEDVFRQLAEQDDSEQIAGEMISLMRA
ncbi:MAG: ABC transporter ATP-binding protein [Acidobacteria bacterium]|nr:ABC transporter ATP-binding protein [Acidobacteriota bacterium]